MLLSFVCEDTSNSKAAADDSTPAKKAKRDGESPKNAQDDTFDVVVEREKTRHQLASDLSKASVKLWKSIHVAATEMTRAAVQGRDLTGTVLLPNPMPHFLSCNANRRKLGRTSGCAAAG